MQKYKRGFHSIIYLFKNIKNRQKIVIIFFERMSLLSTKQYFVPCKHISKLVHNISEMFSTEISN